MAVLLGGLLLALSQLRAAEDSSVARMRRDITFLASDQCEGRGVTTKGVNLAADYIAAEFEKAGLKPGGLEHGYFQPFTIPAAKLESPPTLTLQGPQGQEIELQEGKHFHVLSFSHSGRFTAPLVFAGYGATSDKEGQYDDYEDIDAAGKIVVILRDTPRADNRYSAFPNRQHHRLFFSKIQNAEKHKAAGILFVNDRDTAQDGDDLYDFNFFATLSGPGKVPMFHVRRSVLDEMLVSSLGTTLDSLESDIDRDLRPRSVPLTGWSAYLDVQVTRSTISVKNVVGYLEGDNLLGKETVILGAHYDHLGYGGMGSLADLKKPAIHHGADDNGSGTTTLLELARRFGQMPNREGRRLVFMAFSGEESGLLGSHYYTQHPLFPLSETVAMINMDMVGRLRPIHEGMWPEVLGMFAGLGGCGVPGLVPLTVMGENSQKSWAPGKQRLIVQGAFTARNFDALLNRVNQQYDFKLTKQPGGLGPSDHASFYAKKIPVYFLFTGDHADYHKPSDTSDKINIAGMKRIADFVQDLTEQVSRLAERPQYVKTVAPMVPRTEGPIPRLGIRPSYGDSGQGVLLGAVNEDGPAAKAGLKEGDRIIELAGKPVKDINAYMALIATHKKGSSLEVGILREGKKMVVKITPE
jgi:hypothetical protein